MFNVNEPLEFIIEESQLRTSEIENIVTECVVKINSDVIFTQINDYLSKNIGKPEVVNSEMRSIYTWEDLIYGNSYYCVKETDNIKLYIRECDNKQKAFFVRNGNIVETLSVCPLDKITILNTGEKLDYVVENASVSENSKVEKNYIDAWYKIKSCLSDEQLSKLKYIILSTDGIGGDTHVTYEESMPIQYYIDDMLYSSQCEKQGLLNGFLLTADFMDIIHERGNLYNEKQLQEYINLAWINRKNGLDIPSKWAYESISEAVKKRVLNADMLNEFNKPITRADFCDILYNLVQQKCEMDFDNEKKPIFVDTNKQSINFFANVQIANGVGNNLFIPNGFLTREQAAVILSRTMNFFNIQCDNHIEKKYNDSGCISEWAEKSVLDMQQLGIMIGDENGYFNPQNNCSKEEIITAIMRIEKLF